MKELPKAWKQSAFAPQDEVFCIKPDYKNRICFLQQDIRQQMPEASFDLILCRNLIGFYYDKSLQAGLFQKIHAHLQPEGVLVIGAHETLPPEVGGFVPRVESEPVYIRV